MKTNGKKWIGATALLLAMTLLGGCKQDLYVKTHSGWIKGQWAEDVKGGTRTFLGIPYAQPPVGELRFAAPEPVTHWAGVLQASAFGPSCVQPAGALSAPGDQSEDCLSLNVYSPAKTPKQGAPVMVFIHGGAFVSGGSSQYDGTRLAEEGNAVVVTLNYRLGALGFFSHPDIVDSGNAALQDQQLALHWVKDNIAAFGGDPDNITLFGESAGSASVCTQMVSPGAAGLANRYIMESGVCIGGLQFLSQAQAQAISTGLSASLCGDAVDTVACLRELDPNAMVNWGTELSLFGAGWAPTVIADSTTLPAAPLALFMTGQYHPGAVILGTNQNEWGLFQLIRSAASVSSVAELTAVIDGLFGPAAPYVKAQYLPAADEQANAELIRLYTDTVFRCPTRSLARMLSAQGTPVWLYSFDEGLAYHAMELPYVFGKPNPLLAPELVETLRASVQGYWTGFAANGDPNQDGQPMWPAFDMLGDQHMSLQAVSEADSHLAKSACDMWDLLLGSAE